MNNSILNRINIPVLIVVLTLLITGTGISQTGVGTAVVDNSHRSISSADTVFEYVESFYIGPAAKWDISGVLVLYSKSVWIAPSATITGNGKLVIASPGSNPFLCIQAWQAAQSLTATMDNISSLISNIKIPKIFFCQMLLIPAMAPLILQQKKRRR